MSSPGKIVAFFTATIIIVSAVFVLALIYTENKAESDLVAIKEHQVEDGEHYTATVESLDVSNQELIMDNGHEIDASGLSKQPDVGDKISYIKTFDYEISKWRNIPKDNGETTFINIKIIN